MTYHANTTPICRAIEGYTSYQKLINIAYCLIWCHVSHMEGKVFTLGSRHRYCEAHFGSTIHKIIYIIPPRIYISLLASIMRTKLPTLSYGNSAENFLLTGESTNLLSQGSTKRGEQICLSLITSVDPPQPRPTQRPSMRRSGDLIITRLCFLWYFILTVTCDTS